MRRLKSLDVPGVSIARSLLVVAHWGVSDEFDCGWSCDDGSVEDNGDNDAPELGDLMSSSRSATVELSGGLYSS